MRVFVFSAIDVGLGQAVGHPGDVEFEQGVGPEDIARAASCRWIFIDLMLPAMSGLEICRLLRANPQAADAHVTMVLGQGDEFARRDALRAGADDYMLGAVSRDALLERISARRYVSGNGASDRLIELGDLALDLAAVQARWQGRALRLMPKQFLLLRILMEYPSQVLSRARIIEALGEQCEVTDERTVDVWVKRLREVLRSAGAENVLRTVSGRGYVLDLCDAR